MRWSCVTALGSSGPIGFQNMRGEKTRSLQSFLYEKGRGKANTASLGWGHLSSLYMRSCVVGQAFYSPEKHPAPER